MSKQGESIAQLLQWAKHRLAAQPSAALDARILLCHCLEVSPVYLLTWPERIPSESQHQQFRDLVERREMGEPIAYLVGTRGFWSLSLRVSPDTLIPRPETELLVEVALQQSLPSGCTVLDLGTGTGAIALALASERPDWRITAVDKQAGAVALAQDNAHHLGLQQVDILQSDWFSAVTGQTFDLIVSNPPYVEPDSPYLQQGDVRFEPKSALTAGDSGMQDIEHIILCSRSFLNPMGLVMIEHGFEQAEKVSQCFVDNGFIDVQTHLDMNHLPRMTCAKSPL